MGDIIDFKKTTIDGVAEAKMEAESSAAKLKAENQLKQTKLKKSLLASTAPPPPVAAGPSAALTRSEDKLKAMFIEDSMAKLRGSSSGVPNSGSVAGGGNSGELQQERDALLRKLDQYYALPQFAKRPRLSLGRAASIHDEITQIKAELYEIECKQVSGSQLLFAVTIIGAKVVERKVPKEFADLAGFADDIKVNADVVMPSLEMLAIKYGMTYNVGPWGALFDALAKIGVHTHRKNTDPEYRAQLERMSATISPEQAAKLEALGKPSSVSQ